MRTSFPGETPSAPLGGHMLAKLKAHRQYAHAAPGGLGQYPLRTARARHRTGTPQHVTEWREQADAALVERAREYEVQHVPRVRLAFTSRNWPWARRVILAEIDNRAKIAAGQVSF